MECGNSASIALNSFTLPGPGGESREGGVRSLPLYGSVSERHGSGTLLRRVVNRVPGRSLWLGTRLVGGNGRGQGTDPPVNLHTNRGGEIVLLKWFYYRNQL